MKNQRLEISPSGNPRGAVRRLSKVGLTIAYASLLGFAAVVTTTQAQESGTDEQGVQVLTRGPIHEAFAGIVTYNPEPGVIVEKAPPELIEEMPPEERPTGENITWIPGYWAWDDERGDYLWISGTWRALPPGRQWTTGYWTKIENGYQWISGYWADSSAQETTYLPKPPATVESGPNVAAPSNDYSWSPGYWVWRQERYIWTPGYWALARPDWEWIPAHYVWTPRGYVFVEGYWDYSFRRRGVLYAPVYFQSGYYARPGYTYSPVIAIGLVALMEHLFLRPHYHHYYFGDYYDRRYSSIGYYSPHYYQSSRYGYDPVYWHRRWTHRHDRDWERRYIASYDYRRDNESARPPRTWADQKKLKLDKAETREQQLLMAAPLDQMAKSPDSPLSVERVPAKEREKLAAMGKEVRKNREQRKTLESEGVSITGDKTGREIKPTKAKLPTSPIVGRSPDRFSKKDAPPKPQSTPTVELKKETPDRKPDMEKTKPQTKDQPGPSGPETTKDQKPPQTKKPQAEPERPAEKPKKAPSTQEPQSKDRKQTQEPKQVPRQREEVVPQPKKPQIEPERRIQKPPRQESPPKVREPERKAPQEPRQSGKASPTKPSRPSSETDRRDKEDSEESGGRGKKK